ncbi:hypothetical protein [Cellulomonas sp. C5510]|uniref:hypothetical protein n=1 Tax=Cellulomonas sp. C5510 TaxID=2871170 RepID=UPI001C98C2FA|nr:hypothetical protein [Cellulomonas sp. C5510]QZN86814.1 hypothetical protein K5O09_06785 [Cellulomonas sp. C5510]
MSRHVAPRRRDLRTTRHARSRRRTSLVALVGTTVVTAAVLGTTALTAASYTDEAHLGLGTAGVGSAQPFDVVLLAADGTVHQAAPGTPLPLDLPDHDQLVPGRTVDATLRVANNHPDIASAVSATLAAEPVPGTPDITPFLRVTVLAEDGTVLLGSGADRPQDGARPGTPADLGTLAPRGAEPLPDAGAWLDAAPGSVTSLTIRVHLLDDPATEALNGAQAHLTARLDATSTEEDA